MTIFQGVPAMHAKLIEHLHTHGLVPRGMRASVGRRVGDERGQLRARVRGDCVELGRRQPRVRHERPRIDARGREQQHDLRDAVFRHDHHAVATAHAERREPRRDGIDGLRELGVREPARVLDQRGPLGRLGGPARGHVGDARRQRGEQRVDVGLG
ncbi:hypothetical protein FEP65_06170 [Burkholderia multivorans]|nr:hypothetical protein [Burkholderia multivorans]